jgi:hypothetical protein
MWIPYVINKSYCREWFNQITKLDDSSCSNCVDYDKFNNKNCGSLRTLEDVTTRSPKHEYDC